jgi:hypothetical protein
MEAKQANMLQSLESIQAFLEENADTLARVVNTGAKQRLADAIADLAAHVTKQSGSSIASNAATKRGLDLRHTLMLDHMEPIARIAKAELPRTPGIDALRMPRGQPSTQQLAAVARGMAAQAEPHADLFVAAGLEKDFIAQLTAATDALLASVEERLQSRGKKSGATKGLTDKLAAGRRIAGVLDSFVKKALRKEDPALLANWKVVKRVRKTTVRPAAATTLPPTPAPVPALPAAPVPVPALTAAPAPLSAPAPVPAVATAA